MTKTLASIMMKMKMTRVKMTNTPYNKLRTKVFGIIEGLTLSDPSYFEVRKLLAYAERIHCNVRKDGSKEFSHQLEMLALALSLHDMLLQPRDVYMAIITHDLLEDYPSTKGYLVINHQESVKYSQALAKFKSDEAENEYDVYFQNVSSCPVTSIVKLIDRIHNLSTAVGVFSDAKLKEYVDEVHMYFVPMYQRAKTKFNQRCAYEVLKAMLMIECNTITKFQSRIDELTANQFPSAVTDLMPTKEK